MDDLTNQFVLPLQGKLAIVTGASRGIGAGLAWELARRGANVCIICMYKRLESAIRSTSKRERDAPWANERKNCSFVLGVHYLCLG